MEDGQSSLFDPKAPHFVKIILHTAIQTGKLIIPKKFTRKYGSELSRADAVLLKVPTGDTWEVQLRKENDRVWLENGWLDFVHFYSIRHGDLLVFRYESGSSNELDVVMVDKSATEIEYPLKSHGTSSPTEVDKIRDEEDEVISVGETSDDELQSSSSVSGRPSHILRGNYSTGDKSATEIECPLKSHGTSSPTEVDEISDEEDEVISVSETSDDELQSSSSISRSTSQTLRGNYSTHENVCSKALKYAEKDKALERAKSFKSSNPFFKVVMQPSYIGLRCRLRVPVRFLQKHLGQKKSSELKLRVTSGEKIWTVRYNITIAGKWEVAKVNAGWKAFVVDNGLARGDVCIFELIRGFRSKSFKVTIFKAPRQFGASQIQDSGDGATTSKCEGHSGAKLKGKKKHFSSDTQQAVRKNNQDIPRRFKYQPAADKFVSDYPFFQLVITKGYLSRHELYIPTAFVRDHLGLESKTKMVTFKVGDQSWSTKLIITSPSSHRAIFSYRVGAFTEGNSLKPGDVCTFELIQKAEMVFRVSID